MTRVVAAPFASGPAAPAGLEALVRLHRHAFTTVLVIGGNARRRLRTGLAFHHNSLVRHGPFVDRDGRRDAGALGAAFASRVVDSVAPIADDPLMLAEGGTLFVDHVEALDLTAQRWIFGFLDQASRPLGAGPVWAGRLVFGTAQDPRFHMAVGRFLPDLLDAIDKVRVELNERAPERR